MTLTDRVFVYGTLKVGQRNHHLVADLVVAVHLAVLDDHSLWDCGSHPAARPAPGSRVDGEVLVLREPREALRRLDELEEHPDVYRRRRARVRVGDTSARAWFYELVQLDASWTPCGGSWHPADAHR